MHVMISRYMVIMWGGEQLGLKAPLKHPEVVSGVLSFFHEPKSSNTQTQCSFFAYSWKLPAYSGALLLTVDILALTF